MTQLDQQTDLLSPSLPAEDDGYEPARSRTGLLLVVLAGLLILLLATLAVIADAVARAEAQRIVAAEVRSRIGIPDSERVQVDFAGSVLLQQLLGRYDRVGVTVYSFPTGRANADVTVAAEGLESVDGVWTADSVFGALTLSGAQASALFLPSEAQGTVQVGFSGGDMVVSGSAAAGASTVTVSAAVTPHFENGRLSAAISSLTIGDKTLSADEVAAQTGTDLSALQPAPMCLAEAVPSSFHVRDVRVADQRLRVEFDMDMAASTTAEGRTPGSCP